VHYTFFHSIRFKIMLAFGLLSATVLVLATVAIRATQSIPARILCVASLVVGMLVAVIAARHLIKLVCGGLQRQTGKFDEMAAFLDFSKRSASPRKDEFGRSAAAFDRFLQRVEQAVMSVVECTAELTIATTEIVAGNMDLSTRTEQQAVALEQTAGNMQRLTDAIRKNSDNALEADRLAGAANQLALSGSRAMQDMSVTIGKLDHSSQQISEITALIDGIAFQTNLLALNAAVEAARAGSQGRGFAVVAGEVRNLAHRSSAAAKEIKILIDASVGMVQQGLTQAQQVHGTVEQVQHAIHTVSSLVGAISNESVQQRQRIETIDAVIADMDQTTQQNAALVEQLAAAAQSLEQQAGQLKETVAVFRVAEPGSVFAPTLHRPLRLS